MRRTVRTRVAVLAAVGVLVGAAAPGAAAASGVFVCSAANAEQFQQPRVYAGDVVLADSACGLGNAHVLGDVLVSSYVPEFWHDDPSVAYSVVEGDVHVEGTSVVIRDNTVHGGVYLHGSGDVTLSGTVHGSVRGRANRLWSAAEVDGDLDVRLPYWHEDPGPAYLPDAGSGDAGFELRGGHVHGSVALSGGTASLAGTRVDGRLTVASVAGLVLAETDVGGVVVLRDLRGRVVLGGLRRSEDGPWEWLDDGRQRQSTYGSLVVRRTRGPVEVSHVDVGGDLVCEATTGGVSVDPATTTVGGARTGTCAG